MYEKRCPQKLDEPVIVWMGLEFHEVATAVAVGTGIAVFAAFILGWGFVGMLLGFGAGAGLIAGFRALRAGGPGYAIAWLYRWGAFEILPPPLRPRHFLPLPGRGTRSRFRMSPVTGEEDGHASREARRYFGR